MNNEKYYIPTIEEFHVGFEYETNVFYDHPRHPKFKQTEWVSQIVDEIDEFEDLKDSIESGLIRVKYLDKEDIESLGFKWCSSDSRDSIYAVDNIKSFGNVYYYRIIHCESKNNVIIQLMYIEPYLSPKTVFNGTIKNKSELKKVLIQTKVIDASS